jgi:hypothetical protein
LGTNTSDNEQNHLMIAKVISNAMHLEVSENKIGIVYFMPHLQVSVPEEQDPENRKYSDETEG